MLPIGSAMVFIAVNLAQGRIMCQGGVYAVSAGTAGRAGPAILAGWQTWHDGILQVAARAAQSYTCGDLSYQCGSAIVRVLVTLPNLDSCLMLFQCPAAEILHE